MSYLGQVELKSSEIRRIDVTGSTSATHTLTWTPASEQSLIITINGIKQQNNYSISGVTLTLDDALLSDDKMEVIGILDIGEATIPPDDSITTAMVKDDAIDADKLANSINTEIAANTAKTGITSGQASAITANTAKVTNATHTGDVTGATALTIAVDAVDIAMLSATGTADSTTFLRGDNAWASAGGDNSPSFRATNGSDQSISHNTWTKLAADTENWDTDSAYDAATNYRFTVPTGEGGKYLFFYGAYFEGGLALDKAAEVSLYINNVNDNRCIMRTSASDLLDGRIHGMSFPIALVATDYVECFLRHHGGSTSTVLAEFAYIGGMKLIGI
jgi:hypothetical protein